MLGYHHFSYWHWPWIRTPTHPRGWRGLFFPAMLQDASTPRPALHRERNISRWPGLAKHEERGRYRVAQRMLELSSVGFRPFGAEMVLKLGMIPKCTLNWTFLGRNIHNISGLCWEVLHSVTWILPKAKLSDWAFNTPWQIRCQLLRESWKKAWPSRIQEWFQPKAPSQWIWGDPPAGSREQPHLSRQDARTGVQCTGPAIAKTSWWLCDAGPKNRWPRFLHDFCRVPPSYVSGFICWSKYRYMSPIHIYIYMCIYIHT